MTKPKKAPGESGTTSILRSQQFSLDSVGRHGQDVGVRTGFEDRKVSDAGELQQSCRVEPQPPAGDAAILDGSMVAVRVPGAGAYVGGHTKLEKCNSNSGVARATRLCPDQVGGDGRRHVAQVAVHALILAL